MFLVLPTLWSVVTDIRFSASPDVSVCARLETSGAKINPVNVLLLRFENFTKFLQIFLIDHFQVNFRKVSFVKRCRTPYILLVKGEWAVTKKATQM
jgi:hypothetical protein